MIKLFSSSQNILEDQIRNEMTNPMVSTYHDNIKNWLKSYDKFVANERKDPNFHFSFWLWTQKVGGNKVLIPILIGYLKQPQKGKECVLIGWGWNLNMKSDVVKSVITDPERVEKLVTGLREKRRSTSIFT
jgi:hypothetical protein